MIFRRDNNIIKTNTRGEKKMSSYFFLKYLSQLLVVSNQIIAYKTIYISGFRNYLSNLLDEIVTRVNS